MLLIITSFIGLMIVLLWIAYRRPAMAVAAFLHVFALEQIYASYSYYFFSRSSLINICLGLLCSIAFLRSLNINRKTKFRLTKEVAIYILLVSYVALSGFWAYGDGGVELLKQFFPYFVTMFFVLFTLIRTNDISGFLKGLLLFGAPLVATLAISPHFGVGGIRVPWAHDIYGDELRLNYLELGFTSGIVLVCSATLSLLKKRWFDILIRVLLAVFALYVMIKSGARGQSIFATISAGIAIVLLGKRLTARLVIMALIGSFTIVLFSEIVADIWGSTGSDRWTVGKIVNDWESRLNVALVGLEQWYQGIISIIFGIGHYSVKNMMGSYSHIVPIEVLAEQGLIGFWLFMWLVVRVMKKSKVYIRNANDHVNKQDRVALFSLMLFSFMLIFKQGTVLGNWVFFLFALILTGLYDNDKKKRQGAARMGAYFCRHSSDACTG